MAAEFALVAITTEIPFPDEIKKIQTLLENGFARVHLRHPTLSFADTERLLEKFDTQFLSRIVLHDHHSLAIKYGCGVQTNARHPVKPAGCRLAGHSCHSLSEAVSMKGERDFVTLSPVFDSISKPGYIKQEDLIQQVINADKENLPPLIALGGITFEKIDMLREAGFAGAAMSGAIFKR